MNTLSLYWSVSGVDHVVDYATRRNIKKPVLFPRYQGSLGGTEAPLAYVGSTEIDPDSNLSIIRFEDSIQENSRAAFSGVRQWTGKTNYSFTKHFLLTDIVGDFVSRDPEPFYWKHVLPSGDIDPDSVGILDSDLNDVPEDSYYASREQARDNSDIVISGSYENTAVFSNHQNFYDEDSGELELYFVRYQVNGADHYQVLNSEPAFSEAGLEDVSLVTGQLKPWRKVYILREETNFYVVTVPRADRDYFLRPLERSRIVLQDPPDTSDEVPWFPSVTEGSFIALRDSADGSQTLAYNYSVPEFDAQEFSPLKPYKASIEEVASWLRSDILKVARTPLKVDTSFYTMDILIKDSAGSLLYALTTDASKGGESYFDGEDRVWRDIETENAWVTWEADGIAGWDSEGGFIQLKKNYPDRYFFFVSYYYTAANYEITSLNLNPIFDEEFDGQFYIIYAVPTGGSNQNLTTQTSSIHYAKVDRSGRIVKSSQGSESGNYNLRNLIATKGNIFYTKSLSSTTTEDVIGGGSSVVLDKTSLLDSNSKVALPDEGVVLVGEQVNQEDNYIDTSDPWSFALSYTSWTDLGDDTVRLNTEAFTEDVFEGATVKLFSFKELLSSDGTNDMQWLILAEIRIQPSTRPEDLAIVDLRKVGGVLKEKHYADATKVDPRAVWARPTVVQGFGQPTPGETCAVIKVPYTLLTEYGGSFTRAEVETIVRERHLAAGVIPIVLYDGAIPEITSIVSTSSAVTVCWESEGDNYSYNVYRASLSTGPWTKVNSSLISDQVYGNCYTIDGLSSGLTYYVVVTAVDSNSVEGPKGTPWGIKTRNS